MVDCFGRGFVGPRELARRRGPVFIQPTSRPLLIHLDLIACSASRSAGLEPYAEGRSDEAAAYRLGQVYLHHRPVPLMLFAGGDGDHPHGRAFVGSAGDVRADSGAV